MERTLLRAPLQYSNLLVNFKRRARCPTMRSSRRRETLSLVQAFVPGAADLVSLGCGQSIATVSHRADDHLYCAAADAVERRRLSKLSRPAWLILIRWAAFLFSEGEERCHKLKHSDLVDPEPLSTLLVALGALGSIASLYALIDPRLTSAKAEREANRFAIRDALMGAETGLNELRGYVRSLEIAFAAGTQTRNNVDAMMSVAQFGQVRLLFSREGHERWREIEEGILTTASRIQRHMGDLMRHFAVTNLKLQPDTAHRLQATVEKLNSVVKALVQVHFGELFRLLEEAAGECMDTLRQLRFDLGGFIR